MSRVVFLTQDSMEGYVCDDDDALPAFAAAGLDVDTLSWRDDSVDWSGYDGVIVRSTWDYQRHPKAFFDTLARIDSVTRLANPLALMRWNMDKRYLAELETQGVAIVPTVFGEALDANSLDTLLANADGESVIKPVISAGAERTFRVPQSPDDALRTALIEAHGDGHWMWQPFLRQIVSEGEFSLFYFAGQYSHSILKTPQPGDFRVQEEFGGEIRAVTPEAGLLDTATGIVKALPTLPLYARVDMVRGGNTWQLIELELIEPSLYFRMGEGAAARFAARVIDWLATA